MQFPPEILYISSRSLLSYNIIQTLVVFGNVIDIAILTDGLEMTVGTFNLAFLGAGYFASHYPLTLQRYNRCTYSC